MTYRQLQDATLRFATALAALGVAKGDRVAIMLPNCPQFVVAFYGLLRLGAIAVNTNPLYVSREMKEQFDDAGAETVILLDTFFPRLREIRGRPRSSASSSSTSPRRCGSRVRQIVHLVQRKHGEYVKVRPQEGDIFSPSGSSRRHPPSLPPSRSRRTTSRCSSTPAARPALPKAAMLTHRNLIANTLQVASWFHEAEKGKETLLGGDPVLPRLRHDGVHDLRDRVGRRRSSCCRGPRPVDDVMKVIQKTRASIFPGVPTLYTAINNHPDVKKYDLESVKCCLSGAAPLPLEVAETFERLTGRQARRGVRHDRVVSRSRTATRSSGSGKAGQHRRCPLPDTDAEIVDLETRTCRSPSGEDGELASRGRR